MGLFCAAATRASKRRPVAYSWAANVKLFEFMTLSSRFSGYFVINAVSNSDWAAAGEHNWPSISAVDEAKTSTHQRNRWWVLVLLK